MPSAERVSAAPWWAWPGGALGASYVAGSITSAPKLGAVTLIGLILAGQALASLVVDPSGWWASTSIRRRSGAWQGCS